MSEKVAAKRLFVGGIPGPMRWQGLKELFSEHGDVAFAKVIMDRETGKSRGFGFVEFETEEGAQNAKEAMDGADLEGRELKVDFAQEKEQE